MDVKDRNETALDFSPQGLLQILSQSDRAHVSGVTIDSAKTRVIDDGISVWPQGKGWVIEVSIADVPAMVPDGSVLEDKARDIGYERRGLDGKVTRIFPREFLIDHVSLQEGEERPAITFRIALDKDLDIRSYGISRTMFRNTRKYASEHIQERPGRLTPWIDLGKRLYEKRIKEFSEICDDAVAKESNAGPDSGNQMPMLEEDNVLLIQEAMRLTNHVAADLMRRNGVEAPYRPMRGIVNVDRVTRNLAFDRAVNKRAFDLIQQIEVRTKPSVRITSPMRDYEHFLGLKILGNHLDGAGSSPASGKESRRIVEKFNRNTSGKRSDILSDRWSSEWRIKMTEQGKNAVREIERRRDSKARTLKALCQDQQIGSPDIAERRLKIDSLEATLVGISTGGARGVKERQTWAVHVDAGTAVEIASARMLDMIKKDHSPS
jgi:hypothetical protein